MKKINDRFVAWEEAAGALWKQRQYHLYNYKFNPWEKTIMSNLKLIHFSN